MSSPLNEGQPDPRQEMVSVLIDLYDTNPEPTTDTLKRVIAIEKQRRGQIPDSDQQA